VEVKSVIALTPVFDAQLITYMQLTHCPAGLLINFNVARLMDGVKRLLNPRGRPAPQAACIERRVPAGSVTQ
jgi:hypothetical protein